MSGLEDDLLYQGDLGQKDSWLSAARPQQTIEELRALGTHWEGLQMAILESFLLKVSWEKFQQYTQNMSEFSVNFHQQFVETFSKSPSNNWGADQNHSLVLSILSQPQTDYYSNLSSSCSVWGQSRERQRRKEAIKTHCVSCLVTTIFWGGISYSRKHMKGSKVDGKIIGHYCKKPIHWKRAFLQKEIPENTDTAGTRESGRPRT